MGRPGLSIQGRTRFEGLPARRTLERWLMAAFGASSPEPEITLRFVDAREARRLNRDFRRQDHATNVLTFAYRGPPQSNQPHSNQPKVRADIVICVPVVRREARAQGKAFRDHLAHLVVHGALHALGLDHRSASKARAMEGRERAVLARLGIADPYQPQIDRGKRSK